MRRRKSSGKKKPKTIKVQLIQRLSESGEVREPYRIMEEMVAKYHPHLASAKIAMAWRFDMKPDADGRLVLGTAKKASDLDRELHQYDFVIVLNADMWNRAEFTQDMKVALVDHELCHCEVQKDENGEEKLDTSGRPVWRMRGHDIEEFTEIVGRHGQYKGDIEKFVAAAVASKSKPTTLFEKPAVPEKSCGPIGRIGPESPSDPAPDQTTPSAPPTAAPAVSSGTDEGGALAQKLASILGTAGSKKSAQAVNTLVQFCFENERISISKLQRTFNIGYTKASMLMAAMVEGNLLAPIEGDRGMHRCVMTPAQWDLIKPRAA